jgi:hypothetical protein
MELAVMPTSVAPPLSVAPPELELAAPELAALDAAELTALDAAELAAELTPLDGAELPALDAAELVALDAAVAGAALVAEAALVGAALLVGGALVVLPPDLLLLHATRVAAAISATVMTAVLRCLRAVIPILLPVGWEPERPQTCENCG